MSLSSDEVLDLFLQLFPDGFTEWMDVRNTSSNIYKLFAGFSDSLKLYFYDFLDNARAEWNPRTATVNLPDYEAALGLTATATAQSGTVAARRTAVVSKFRESGAFTASVVRSIIAPLLGYVDPSTLTVMECSRSALKAAHTYAGGAISWNPTASGTLSVTGNGGTVSAAGAQVVLTNFNANPGQMTITLTAPDSTSYVWVPSVTARYPGSDVYLGAPALAGAAISGTWTLTINDNGPNAGTLDSWTLFVEGIAPGQETGGAIFDWGVYADPALTIGTPDLASIRASIARVKHAHTVGNLIQSIAPYPNTDSGIHSAIPDECTPV